MFRDFMDVEVLRGNERDIEVPLLLADLAIIFDHTAGKKHSIIKERYEMQWIINTKKL